jgi:protein O-mannosyl-transferase
MAKQTKPPIKKGHAAQAKKKSLPSSKTVFFPWMLLLTGITMISFFPMLNNQFTNWDDGYYVVQNPLLQGPDWNGIFTQQVNDNYHPLTIISYALNFQFSGLSPFSYFLLNLLLHITNTLLVFYFTWLISGKKPWVGFFTALIFAIHPMHVESVAWISERKDVLYSLFFLLSLIQYWKYLTTDKKSKYWICLLFFCLSLLSKPAAIILPFILLLLDYWKGRRYEKKIFTEKIPFFLLSILFAVITWQIQSDHSIISSEVFSLGQRLMFACYGLMIYLIRFFFPQPLSAFHPFPSPDKVDWQIMIAPLVVLALAALVLFYRKNKLIVFSLLFFVINLLLVLQIVSIGNTIVAERYTYVPYIGLAFLLSMWLHDLLKGSAKLFLWVLPSLVLVAFGVVTFQRSKVWHDSLSLWNDVIEKYPATPVPRTNRANYFYTLATDSSHAGEAAQLFQQALDDCNVAIKTEPRHKKAYELRGLIFQSQNRNEEALADGQMLIKLAPQERRGYSISSTANMRLNKLDEALADLDMCIQLKPDDDMALNNRATILYNRRKFSEARDDYSKAININPKGVYYLNRSNCYFELGDMLKARADAQVAMQKGMQIDDNYRRSLNL